MDEGRIKVEMEEGMLYEFSGREDEELVLQQPDSRIFHRGVPSPIFTVQFVFFDIRNSDMEDNHQVIAVEINFSRRPIAASCLKSYFNVHLAHGLSQQELDDCMAQFSAVMEGIISRPNHNIDNGSGYKRRRFTFDVKRRGVVGTRYGVRQIEMREEEVECRNRMNKMLALGQRPANPDEVDQILGNWHWSMTAIPNRRRVGECCICLEEFKEGEYKTGLACCHTFHTHCIAQWFNHKNTCPICRRWSLHLLYVPHPPSGLPNPYL